MAHVQKKTYRSNRTGKTATAWQARYTAPDGRERTKRFTRKVDAEKWLDVNGADIARGSWVDPAAGKVRFRDYAEAWKAAQVHRPSTSEQVQYHLDNHILPAFGDRELASIRPTEIQAFVRSRGESLSPATVEVIYRYLSAIFKAAVRDRAVGFNPCDGTKLARAEQRLVVPLETEQVLCLVDALPDHLRATAVLAAGAGLRQGEVLGLTGDRVDFLRRSLTIDRQLVTLARQPLTLAPPKTEASVRKVPMPDFVSSALAAHMAEHPAGEWGLLFTDRQGRPIPRNRFGETWRAAVAKAKIGRPARFHDLRHYYASLLIRHGESVKVVQARLGHSSASETLDTYAHLWPDSEDRTRLAIDTVLLSDGQETDDVRETAPLNR